MQIVSENWKNAHRQTLLNESFVEVSLGIGDPDAIAAARSRDNGAIYISESPQLSTEEDKNIIPYCTLEQNLWVLDGSREAIPESNYGDCGYIGDAISDDNCVFSDVMPIITVDFKEVFIKLIPGVTITWSTTFGEFADTFTVLAYKGDEVVSQKEVIGNRSVTTRVWFDIIDYDRIEIWVKKWCLPHHRARIEEFFVGINMVYSKKELFDYSHTQSVDPISTSLPKAEVRFAIDNVNGEYNPYNEDGISKYLMERQEIGIKYGLKTNEDTIEWINGGTFYLSEWYAKQNGMTADFTARDLLEFMSANYSDTSYYNVINDTSLVTDDKGNKVNAKGDTIIDKNGNIVYQRSLFDLAILVLNAANLPLNGNGTPKWTIDESLKTRYTTAPLPEDTLANCLQLIANAGGCTIYQDRTGTLCIESINFDDIDTDYEIDSFNSYTKPEITLSKPIKQVIVKAYNYNRVENGIDSTTVEVVDNVGIVGETITVDNPLITCLIDESGTVNTSRAYAICSWLTSYLQRRMTLDFSWRADVRLDALDMIRNQNNYRTNNVLMTDVEFEYNGAFRGTGKGKVI